MSSLPSLLQLLETSCPAERTALKDALADIGADTKRRMDAGLTPDEMAVVRPVHEAVLAAARIAETLLNKA